MACYVNKVVATAIGEIGYKESGTNVTKYSKYFDRNYPNFYNTAKQGAEWCDIFVDYCVLVNSADENEAEYVLCQPAKSCGAGCKFSYDYYKQKGRVGNDPQIGAQIFFGTGKKPNHTGIVIDVTDDSVVTVEGNSDNEVKKHTYKKTTARIYGYGYPRYSEEQAEKPAEPKKSVDEVAKEVIAGKWGNNPERKKKLVAAGYDYDEVQKKVNELLKKEEKPKAPAPAPVQAPAGQKYKVRTNGSSLALRKRPDNDAIRICWMPNGSEVTVDDTRGNWSHTTFNGQTGWAFTKWLEKI